VSECTKVGGYFVGTCYDGDAVFALLRRKNEGESVAFVRDNKKVFEITKRYAQTAFPENEHSVGYAVDVYQDSINKTFREYLVSFVYLTRLLEDFGFVLVSDAEATGMGLPSGSAMFSELFERMEDEVRAKPSSAVEYGDSLRMTPEDKMISFLNRYFVFRKERSVDTESMEKVLSPTRTAEEARAKPDSKNTEETKKGDDPEPEPEPEPESAPKKPAAKKLRVPRLTIKASPKRP
jgi:hypothetical protein